jgi:hypothetical protein
VLRQSRFPAAGTLRERKRLGLPKYEYAMKNTRYYPWLFLSLFSLLVACQSKPKFINHPQPNLPVSLDAFRVGCPQDEYGSPPCISAHSLAALGCDEIQVPSSLVSGLYPSYPIAICQIKLAPDQAKAETQAEIENGFYFYYTGGLFGSYIRYVIVQDGAFRLIKSEDEFRDIYAPIESPEEALSYVLAVTNLSAYYGLAYNSAYKYEVGTIEDTHVTLEPDGYQLHLYYDGVFGCGPHWTSEVEMQVTQEGLVREMSRKPIFRDPHQDELCVD